MMRPYVFKMAGMWFVGYSPSRYEASRRGAGPFNSLPQAFGWVKLNPWVCQ